MIIPLIGMIYCAVAGTMWKPSSMACVNTSTVSKVTAIFHVIPSMDLPFYVRLM